MRVSKLEVTSSSSSSFPLLLLLLLILQVVAVVVPVSSILAQGTVSTTTTGGSSSSSSTNGGGCRLPESWKGKWFQSGVQSPITITARAMETKGVCYESSGDKFLFVEQANNCHRCIVINERHPNVLQYKESMYCEEPDGLENLCSSIPGDAQLYSLFRLDGTPEDCPFRGAPFTFTYNRGYGECKYPVSRVDACTESSRLLLRYQACPDVPKTESTAEEMQCIGQWREGSQHYLIAKIHHRLTASFEDSYRCFAFEKIKGPGGSTAGYKVAQSGDATCSGVSSPSEGARTLTFTKVEAAAPKCKFPSWFSSHRWHSLDGRGSLRFYHKNTTFHVVDESVGVAGGKNNSSGTAGYYNFQNFNERVGSSSGGGGSNFLTSGGARVTCLNMKEISSGRHVALQAHYILGCKSMTLCLHIYKRDRHVVELQALEVSGSDDNSNTFACGRESVTTASRVAPFATFINSEASYRRCPYLGRYAASGVVQDGRVVRDTCSNGGGGGSTAVGQAAGSFHTVVVGCGDRETMEFHSSCPNQEQSTAFACHGSWEENGMGFVIASPMSRSSTTARRYCFIYTSSPEGVLRVSSSRDSCQRSPSPNVEGTWAFNLTVEGQCAEAVTGSGASRITSPSVIIPTVMISSSIIFSSLLPLSISLVSSPLIPKKNSFHMCCDQWWLWSFLLSSWWFHSTTRKR